MLNLQESETELELELSYKEVHYCNIILKESESELSGAEVRT